MCVRQVEQRARPRFHNSKFKTKQRSAQPQLGGAHVRNCVTFRIIDDDDGTAHAPKDPLQAVQRGAHLLPGLLLGGALGAGDAHDPVLPHDLADLAIAIQYALGEATVSGEKERVLFIFALHRPTFKSLNEWNLSRAMTDYYVHQ